MFDIIAPVSVIMMLFLITSAVVWKSRKNMRDGKVLPIGQRHCPTCGHLLPAVRQPANTRQMLWGGWTCPECQTEVDRRGRLIASAEGHHLQGSLSTPQTAHGQGGLSEVAAGQLTDAEVDVAFEFDEAQQSEDAQQATTQTQTR